MTLKKQLQVSQFQENILPKSSTWRQPIIGISTLFKLKAYLKTFRTNSRFVAYLYEGSFSWAILLAILNYFGRLNIFFVVNIFPSQDFFTSYFTKGYLLNRQTYILRFLLAIFKSLNIYITFDNSNAKILPQTLVGTIPEFPLFSSIEKVSKQRRLKKAHANVLILERNYRIDDLDDFLSQSCTSCSFYIARPEQKTSNDSPNLHFLPSVISRDDYSRFYERFDYAIFLYDVPNNSSGKMLDICQLNIPACIPTSATYLNVIARRSIPFYEFDIQDLRSIKLTVNHPTFKNPVEESDWGPESFPSRLRDLVEKGQRLKKRWGLIKFLAAILLLFYFCFSRLKFIMNLIFVKFSRLISNV